MNLYLVTNTIASYDQYDAMVVAAETPAQAMRIHPAGAGGWDNEPIHRVWGPRNLTCERIGTAGKFIKAGVILASFKAG